MQISDFIEDRKLSVQFFLSMFSCPAVIRIVIGSLLFGIDGNISRLSQVILAVI
jgi:hypothetical protein